MSRAATPANEAERLAELHALDILDTLSEQSYEDITFLASQICESPIAVISLVDTDRQWFKSVVGLDTTETSRDVAFCAHAILEPANMLVVPDATADQRFADNPLVTGDPAIRFYAGAPLVTAKGNALGTLCVIDTEPRDLTPDQHLALEALSRQVMAQLEQRLLVAELEKRAEERAHYEEQLEDYQRMLESTLDQVATQSLTDPLTGLGNRRALIERLETEMQRHDRSGAMVSLALIDVDHFKELNDGHGHPVGDETLIQLAALFKEHSRNGDFVARFGGDEFAVIMTDTGYEGGLVIAERIRRSVEREAWRSIPVTISVGVATVCPEAKDTDGIIAAADAALYRAKEAGRNATAVHEPL